MSVTSMNILFALAFLRGISVGKTKFKYIKQYCCSSTTTTPQKWSSSKGTMITGLL